MNCATPYNSLQSPYSALTPESNKLPDPFGPPSHNNYQTIGNPVIFPLPHAPREQRPGQFTCCQHGPACPIGQNQQINSRLQNLSLSDGTGMIPAPQINAFAQHPLLPPPPPPPMQITSPYSQQLTDRSSESRKKKKKGKEREKKKKPREGERLRESSKSSSRTRRRKERKNKLESAQQQYENIQYFEGNQMESRFEPQPQITAVNAAAFQRAPDPFEEQPSSIEPHNLTLCPPTPQSDASELKKARKQRSRHRTPKRKQYVVEGMGTGPDHTERTVRSRDSSVQTEPESDKDESKAHAKQRYVGVHTYKEAEDAIKGNADFVIYHQLPLDHSLKDLYAELKLFICYRTVTGSFRHYRIRQRTHEKKTNPAMYYVDYGDPNALGFINLDQLVKYYAIYGTLRRSYGGPTNADLFPWWD